MAGSYREGSLRAGKGIPLAAGVWAVTAMTAASGFGVIAVAVWAIGYVTRLPVSRR